MIDLKGWNVDLDLTRQGLVEREAGLAADLALLAWQEAMVAWADAPTTERAARVLATMEGLHAAYHTADLAHCATADAQRKGEMLRLRGLLDRIAVGVSAADDVSLLGRLLDALRAQGGER